MAMANNTRTLTGVVGVVVVMGALAWAAVPFYNWFCKVTGYGGTTGTRAAASGAVLDQTIKVRFDASRDRGFPWEFRPMQREIELRIGETALIFYEAVNPTDRVVAGQASYNVTPYAAGTFFNKIDCFCFTEQVLRPGQRVEMPVTFFVDPGIVTDRDGKFVHTITLSYTFYEIDLPTEQAALAPAGETATTTN